MSETTEVVPKKGLPRLVASTGDIYQTAITESHAREEAALNGSIGNGLNYRTIIGPKSNQPNSNIFRSAEWTSDGTTLVAVTEDNCVRTFIVPPDLLTSPDPQTLLPYSISPLPTTPYCISPYPFFSLSDPSTTLFLTSLHSQPIHLRSLLYPHIAATYPLIHPTTEKYLVPNSLTWTPTGTHFLAGTDSQIHLFDVSRVNSGPMETFTTGKKRKSKSSTTPTFSSSSVDFRNGSNSSVRSIISTLAIHPVTNNLAAGTYSRRVLLYSSPYQDGELYSVINLNSLPDRFKSTARGNGITSISFADGLGNRIIIAERKSEVVYCYDLRYTSEPWAVLTGRKAATNQKLGVSFAPVYGDRTNVVLAGGTDGIVNIWEPFASSGSVGDGGESNIFIKPVDSFSAANDPVTSVAVHASGAVVATSSGERKSLKSGHPETQDSGTDEDDDKGDTPEDSLWDNGVRVWTV
ncbi:hypothetical protein H072_2624 [Dactylellina haptotyla CBS 200.50]|uniref:Anaphase-promoting complex subunit 4 WD40 domain-containing protein n=1 Tax=Dactylellina haptotyla (strain CBS 200.50) TaxID=1284197 RepID=S8AQN5_DACHA|nr:hypothetical protein H072_2624 [Dactylellina haptotyla CBS 200.50]